MVLYDAKADSLVCTVCDTKQIIDRELSSDGQAVLFEAHHRHVESDREG